MQIVIELDEKLYTTIKSLPDFMCGTLQTAIKNSVPLPKGHGRLIDADKLKTHFIGTEQGTDLEVYLEPTIMNAPTIIEADKEESEAQNAASN